MLQTADLTIRLNPNDDVVIARVELPAGTELIKEGVRLTVNVPAGHKIAIRDIAEGKPVRRYNQIIGHATKPIRAGEHVHVHNLGMAHFERDYALAVKCIVDPNLPMQEVAVLFKKPLLPHQVQPGIVEFKRRLDEDNGRPHADFDGLEEYRRELHHLLSGWLETLAPPVAGD